MASTTTDGAKNELKAAFEIVNEDNVFHCAAHNIQLVINDVMDPKKANPPPTCAPHREIVRKCHGLVIFINNHKDTHSVFLSLAKAKIAGPEGQHMFQALIEDVVTRWDSELAMMERLYYFDSEIMDLCRQEDLKIPGDLPLTRFEFDLMRAMCLVLIPFRIFTKFVQNKAIVTLAYLPKKIDDLVSHLRPGSFAARLQGCAEGVLEQIEAFQLCLVASIRQRFAYLFEAESLALAARMFLPGRELELFTFANFPLAEGVLDQVKENLISADYCALLPEDMPNDKKDKKCKTASSIFNDARDELDEAPEDVDPLEWWPAHSDFSLLYPLAKMLLQIPASSAENERSFSSASFVLDERRTRLDLDNFRREHRIRRYLCAHGPKEKLNISNNLIQRYSDRLYAIREGNQ